MGCHYTTELLKLKTELETNLPEIYNGDFLADYSKLELKDLTIRKDLQREKQLHLKVKQKYYPVLIYLDHDLKECLLKLTKTYPNIKLFIRVVPYCLLIRAAFMKGITLEKILREKLYLKEYLINSYCLIFDDDTQEELGKIHLKCVYNKRENQLIIEQELIRYPTKTKRDFTQKQKEEFYLKYLDFYSNSTDKEGNKSPIEEIKKMAELKITQITHNLESPTETSRYLHCILDINDYSIIHIDGEYFYYNIENYQKRYNEKLDIGKGTIKKKTYKLFMINGKMDLKEITIISESYFQFQAGNLNIKY